MKSRDILCSAVAIIFLAACGDGEGSSILTNSTSLEGRYFQVLGSCDQSLESLKASQALTIVELFISRSEISTSLALGDCRYSTIGSIYNLTSESFESRISAVDQTGLSCEGDLPNMVGVKTRISYLLVDNILKLTDEEGDCIVYRTQTAPIGT